LEDQPIPTTFELSELVAGSQYKLTTSRRLDYELDKSCGVVIVCIDLGQAALTTRVNLTVSILDRNDNSPQFQQSRYQMRVTENKPADFVVEQVPRNTFTQQLKQKTPMYISDFAFIGGIKCTRFRLLLAIFLSVSLSVCHAATLGCGVQKRLNGLRSCVG